MSTTTSAYAALEGNDRNWMIKNSHERHLLAAERLFLAEETVSELYMVIEGEVALIDERTDGTRSIVFTIGAGNFICDLEFLSGLPALVTAEAIVPTVLLTISRQTFEKKIREDSQFSANIYRAIVFAGAERMHHWRAVEKLYGNSINIQKNNIDKYDVPELAEKINAFKRMMVTADQRAIHNGGSMPNEMECVVRSAIVEFTQFMEELIGTKSTLSVKIKEAIGEEIQCELLPYTTLAGTVDRFYAKPRGYAGDYLTIMQIYENKPCGVGRIGALLDECFLALPAAQAVRNRRQVVGNYISTAIKNNDAAVTEITSFACGPAEEVFDAFSILLDPTLLHANLIDIDFEALAYVENRRNKLKLNANIQLFRENLMILVDEPSRFDIAPQDIVYSIGLIDYFSANFVVKLIDLAFDMLKPGGRLVLGNFHKSNPNKAMMDYLCEWRLIHRDEEDMHDLYLKSKFGKRADDIIFEAEGINMFAVCIKPLLV